MLTTQIPWATLLLAALRKGFSLVIAEVHQSGPPRQGPDREMRAETSLDKVELIDLINYSEEARKRTVTMVWASELAEVRGEYNGTVR